MATPPGTSAPEHSATPKEGTSTAASRPPLLSPRLQVAGTTADSIMGTSAHPLAEPLVAGGVETSGSKGKSVGTTGPRSDLSALYRKNGPADDDVPASYRATSTLQRGQQGRHDGPITRMGYFDLQRLAQQAESPSFMRVTGSANEPESDSFSVRSGMSQRDEDERGAQDEDEAAGIPAWLRDNDNFVEPARSASRGSRHPRISDAAASIVRSQSRPTRPPSRADAPPSAWVNSRQPLGVSSPTPFAMASSRFSSRGALAIDAQTSAYLSEDTETEDEEGWDTAAEEKRIKKLASLHRMDEDQLCRLMNLTQQHRPTLSPLQSTNARSPADSPIDGRSISESFVSNTAPAETQTAASSAALDLVKTLSKALASMREDARQYRRAYEQERAKNQSQSSAIKKSYEWREEAMRDILTSAGVSKARVDRALTHAQAQAEIPVFSATERRVKTPSLKKTKGTITEDRLPASLMEAMQDGMDDTIEPRLSRANTVKRPVPMASRGIVLNQGSDTETDVSHSEANASTSRGVSPLKRRDSENPQIKVVTPGSTAGELMPWAGKASARKSAPVVQTSVSGPGQVDEARGEMRASDSTRQSTQAGRSRGNSQSSYANEDGRFLEPSAEASSSSAKLSSGRSHGGFDFFATFGWRKKRPSPYQTKARSPSDSVSHEHAPATSSAKEPASSQIYSAEVDSQTSKTPAEEGETISPAPGLARSDTIRAKTQLIRPEPTSTLSGKDVVQAMHDAIGSLPPSPERERNSPMSSQNLPKPPHFKAIFLATRIMTPDPASVVLGGKVETGNFIKGAAMNLVRRARDEGCNIVESATPRATRTLTQSNSARTGTAAPQAARNVDARTSKPLMSNPTSGGTSTAATLTKALSRYTRSARIPVEPNVTRLPGLFGLGLGGSGQTSSQTRTQDDEKPSAKQEMSGNISSKHAEKRVADQSPIVTELEPVLAREVRPPTFSLLARHAKAQTLASRQRQPANEEEALADDESSGDEFEVYGGKNVDYTQIQTLANSIHHSRDGLGGESALLTDRYGFVYDATPTDVRLLRRAKQESTHAPACLTGIRVGVQARGASDSESESQNAEDAMSESDDSESPVSTEEPRQELGESKEQGMKKDDDKAMLGASPRKTRSKRLSMLDGKPASPLTGQVDLSSALHAGNEGPNCPSQERLHLVGTDKEAQEGESTAETKKPTGPRRNPPSSSQTVRKLLNQLQEMHAMQQDQQKAKWDTFLEKRKVSLRKKVHAMRKQNESSANLGNANSSDDVRRGGGALGLNVSSSVPPTSSSLSPGRNFESNDENWTLGGLIGSHATAMDSAESQTFLKLIQGGVPLVYRAKVWYECSGAGELTEPGRYEELLKEHQDEENACTKQIDLDVGRTMPTNIFFSGDGPGVPKLRRLLVAYSWYNTRCGYCQGMNNLAATLLLTHATEDEAFWVLACIVERILPEDYFTSHLLTAQADQRVLIDFIDELLPKVGAHIRDLGVDLPAVTFAWFLSLYTDCLPVETLFRVWDVMLVEGHIVLFRIAVAIFTLHQRDILETHSPSTFYSQMHGMTSHLFSADKILRVACEDLSAVVRLETVLERRAKHLADLHAELGLEATSTATASGSQTPSTSSMRA